MNRAGTPQKFVERMKVKKGERAEGRKAGVFVFVTGKTHFNEWTRLPFNTPSNKLPVTV